MRRRLVTVTMVAVLGLATACGSNGSGGGSLGGPGASATPAGPQVTITPVNGTKKATPSKGITITATNGTLQNVQVTDHGAKVAGGLSADKTIWKSRWPLTPGDTYQASAGAQAAGGQTATAASKFKALMPSNGLEITAVTPARDTTVGVGMPITVTFNHTVTNKAAVERTFQIRSEKVVTGGWHWITGNVAVFRTKNGSYWPADQKVSFTAHLAGVKVGSTFGVNTVTHNFKIGDRHELDVSAVTDKAVAKANGKVVNSWGVSLGSSAHASWVTTSGIHLVMNHQNPVEMTSRWMGVDPKDTKDGGYDEKVPFASQITNSGEYVHVNTGAASCLGHSNCSHGCVRSTAAGAEWFYHWSYLGDPVVITGTNNPLAWNNGWGYYQMAWKQWLQGSATGQPVKTDGSFPGVNSASTGG